MSTGLSDRDTNISGHSEVPATHGDVDADGRNSTNYGRSEPHGTINNATKFDAECQQYEHHVDERGHGHGGVSGNGLHGYDNDTRWIPQWLSAR